MHPLATFSPKQSLALITAFHSIAIPTTLIRLAHRFHSRRLWWDDFWAAVALASEIILFVVYVTTVYGKDAGWISRPNNTLQQASRWLTLIFYSLTLWSARLTVAITIVRILPVGPVRRIAKGSSILFGAFAMTMIFQKLIACTQGKGSVSNCTTVSKYNLYTGIMELISDVIADLWLLLAPAYILFQMKLQPSKRNLILAIFLCGIFTSLASIAHVVFILLNSPLWLRITGHIEVSIAIVVSNLLVVVTYVYRVFRQIKANEEEDRLRPVPNPALAANTNNEGSTPETALGQVESNNTSQLSSASANCLSSSSPSSTQYTQPQTLELTSISASNEITEASYDLYTVPSSNPGTLQSSPFSSFSYPNTADADMSSAGI